jgi:hypothetical protein
LLKDIAIVGQGHSGTAYITLKPGRVADQFGLACQNRLVRPFPVEPSSRCLVTSLTNRGENMRKIFLAGAALGLLASAAAPASAMPVAKIAPAVTNDDAGVVQVHYRRYYSRYSYRPRYRRSYGYYGGGPSYYSGGPSYYGGGPSYYGGGYGGGYYGGGPSIGFSFGSGRW